MLSYYELYVELLKTAPEIIDQVNLYEINMYLPDWLWGAVGTCAFKFGVDKLKSKINVDRQKKQLLREMFNPVFLGNGISSFGNRHVDDPNKISWTDMEALTVLNKIITPNLGITIDKKNKNEFYYEKESKYLTPRNLILTTGPIGSEVTASEMGYNFDNPHNINELNIPFAYDITPVEELENLNYAEIIQKLNMGTLDEPPIFPIVDTISGNYLGVPQRREEFRYTTDYGLIIIKPPEEEHLKKYGKRDLIISGCHGEGTLGCVHALNDLKILHKMARGRDDSEFFVTIIRTDIKGYRPLKRTIDGNFECIDKKYCMIPSNGDAYQPSIEVHHVKTEPIISY